MKTKIRADRSFGIATSTPWSLVGADWEQHAHSPSQAAAYREVYMHIMQWDVIVVRVRNLNNFGFAKRILQYSKNN